MDDNDEAITGWALAARAGDREAATAFIRATTPGLRRLLAYLADPGYVEDLVQETYLRAFTALPRYAEHAPARVWLYAIARRVAADHIRAAKRRPRPAAGDPQHQLESRRTTESAAGQVELHQTIAALQPDRREAFVLTTILGLTYAEAAQACGCRIGTIRSRVARARTDLLTAVTDEGNNRDSAGTANP